MLSTEKECIEYIHCAGRFGKKAGLENIKALLYHLGNPQNDLKFIHVAGTNGKGSVTCMLSNMLISHGYKVGINVSPYIESFNERLQINNRPIPAEKLVYYTNIVAEAVEKLNKENCRPIEFEIIAAIGFLYFRDEKCDVVVLECGLGGRFDATNVIDRPLLSVICRVGLDHTEILGDTIEKIAFEKAGIIKPNCPVAVHPQLDTAALRVIKERADECNSTLYETPCTARVLSSGLNGTDFEYMGEGYRLNLLGEYQVGNALLAINAARLLTQGYSVSKQDIKSGLESAKWKCRFENINGRFIIDGAHNFQGICGFAGSVEKYLGGVSKTLVIGMLNDKDFESSAQRLCSLGAKIIVTDVPNYRQTEGKAVFESIKKYDSSARYIPDYKTAVRTADFETDENGFVCIAGSLYLAGAVRSFIMSKNSYI